MDAQAKQVLPDEFLRLQDRVFSVEAILNISIRLNFFEIDLYDGPNGSLFISILLHNSEFRILNSEFRNLHCEFRNSEFGIVKYM